MITTQDVEDAQERWGQGIVEISSAYSEGGDFVNRAEIHIDSLYDYKDGSVLFKPTFASEVQFRSTFDSALSYFVGEKWGVLRRYVIRNQGLDQSKISE